MKNKAKQTCVVACKQPTYSEGTYKHQKAQQKAGGGTKYSLVLTLLWHPPLAAPEPFTKPFSQCRSRQAESMWCWAIFPPTALLKSPAFGCTGPLCTQGTEALSVKHLLAQTNRALLVRYHHSLCLCQLGSTPLAESVALQHHACLQRSQVHEFTCPKNGASTRYGDITSKSKQILLFKHIGNLYQQIAPSSWFKRACLHEKGTAYRNWLWCLDEKDVTWKAAHEIHANENRDWHQLCSRNLL